MPSTTSRGDASLRRLSFNARKDYATSQVAWLKARLPESVQSNVVAPLFSLGPITNLSDGTVTELDKNILVVGKRKPALNSRRDAARIQRYVEEFDGLVQRFRDDPGAQPN